MNYKEYFAYRNAIKECFKEYWDSIEDDKISIETLNKIRMTVRRFAPQFMPVNFFNKTIH